MSNRCQDRMRNHVGTLVGVMAVFVVFGLVGSVYAAGNAVKVDVVENTGDRIMIDYTVGDFQLIPVKIDGQEFAIVSLDKEAEKEVVGAPALPHVCRSVVIPNDAKMAVSVVKQQFEEYADVLLAPSKGPLPRTVNPDEVPYVFGDHYAKNEWYPQESAVLGEPYILRNTRGAVVEFNPFQYNPITRTLRVCRSATIEIARIGVDTVNILEGGSLRMEKSLAFEKIYRNHFLNYTSGGLRYSPLDEQGNMLIIAHDAWLSNVQPLVDHKNLRGIDTTLVGVSTIGNNSTSIKNYIQNLYDTTDLAFVLLVGDSTEVATPSASGGASDPSYSKLAGSDDYPDILVGRFSAQSAADVDTQVLRTVEYEGNAYVTQDWFKRAVGIASDEGGPGQGDDDESDIEHMNNIRTDLLGYEYTTVDQFYDPGATAAQVAAAVNAGRGLINYVGHGSTTAWSTTGFSVSNINALTNNNMLPFIFDVACVNGNFNGSTCFAEAWLRATNGAEPTGAIGIYASSINQSWASPMCGQDECNDLLVAETYVSFGALCFGGACQMMDEYGSDGIDMFNTWHVFGDPSLQVLLTCSSKGSVSVDSTKYACSDTVTIEVNDCDLNTDDGIVEQVTVNVASGLETGEQAVLTETGPGTAVFSGSMGISESDAIGILHVADGEIVTVTYLDVDDGQGGTNVSVTATAVVDCELPVLSNVQAIDIGPRTATVTLNADEPVKLTVHYGDSCAVLSDTASGSGFLETPTVTVTGLDPEERYYYTVEATDEAGNVATSDNGGVCYSFMTPSIPNFFTQLFESGDAFDLANRKLTFTPNGTYDYYAGCVDADPITELPTDPSTGTVLVLTDDSYASLTLTGGKTIPFFGANYSEFFPVSNGYLSFVHGVTDYSETLDEHFSGVPKICALYDDLNPADGGTISWEQFSDRVVVTWDSVPQHSTSGDSNTFQIEMFFDGTITISYLEIGAVDGLAGLSRGEGMDPDFEETDLSAMSDCGPQRPLAFDDNVSLPANGSLSIELPGRDDGLPDPPAAVDYIITALPSHGDLSDPGSGAITAVPYILASNGNVVDYTPEEDYYGSDSLKFKLNDGGVAPDGGDSDEATISIGVIANPPTTQNVSVDLDMNGSATVHLLGNDIDGDDLDYTIMSLPQHGVLSDPSGGAITSTPYTLLGGGEDVLYTAEADYAGADVFMYYASDEIFNSTASTVSLQVIAPAPVITTSVLADGLVLESYGPVQLEVSGGQPTVQWQLVTEQIYAETDLGQSNFGEVGVAKGWHKDEGFWYYFMPFAFPFYGEEYSLIRIRPNGFIDFGSFDGSASENSVTSLINNRMIALLWDDLKTTGTGEDMFIDESVSGSVTIRWRASTYAGDSALNISLTLVDDGTIYFDYGSGNTNVAATVGVSDGDGVHYTVGSYDGLTDLGGLNSVRFHVPLLLPGGMGLSSTGILSGVPAETGDFEPVFKVTDSLGRSDQKVIALHITDFVAGDCDYDGDGDVDLADYAGFQSCYGDTGSPACSMFHSNDDGVIDAADFAAFVDLMDGI